MNSTSIQSLILDNLAIFGTSVLAILGAVLVIGIGYLVFRFGYMKIQTSLTDEQDYALMSPYRSATNGWGFSDDDFDRAYSEYRSKGGKSDRDSFGEHYFDV